MGVASVWVRDTKHEVCLQPITFTKNVMHTDIVSSPACALQYDYFRPSVGCILYFALPTIIFSKLNLKFVYYKKLSLLIVDLHILH